MKKILVLLLVTYTFISCDTEGEVLKGDFIYFEDAAVFQNDTAIFAVTLNKEADKLNALANKYKKEQTDMVPVEIKGIITPKPENEEGWEYRVEITEILNVSAPNPNDNSVIKIGKQE